MTQVAQEKGLFGLCRTVYQLCNRSLRLWGALTIASGLVAFAFDFLFAISLQRFFAATHLISGSAGNSFLGEVGSPVMEACFFLFMGALRAIANWANSYATGVCQVSFESRFRREIAEWALRSGDVASGRVSTLFNDIVVGSAAVVSSSFYLFSRFALIAATAVVLVTYSVSVTGMVLLVVVCAMPLHRGFDRKINKASIVIQQAMSSVSDRLMSGVKNAIFFHVHGLLDREVKAQHSLVGSYERASRTYYSLASARGAVPQMIGLVVVTVIAVNGADGFSDKSGGLVAYLYLVLRLFQGLSDAARVTANIRGNYPRLAVLMEWWQTDHLPLRVGPPATPAIVTDLTPPDSVGIRLKSLAFGWASDYSIMSDVNLQFAPGTVSVVVGPSGAGKTSLLLLLAAMVKPTQGAIEVMFPDGVSDISLAKHRLLPVTAYVGPDPFVVKGSLREFLEMGQNRPHSDDELFAALNLAHCEFVEILPDGLAHQLSEQGGGLSAGQKQRLSLARALLRKPQLLLLDEATANLDALSESKIIETLASLKGTLTIVAITHRDSLRAIADQLIEFDGRGGLSVSPRQH